MTRVWVGWPLRGMRKPLEARAGLGRAWAGLATAPITPTGVSPEHPVVRRRGNAPPASSAAAHAPNCPQPSDSKAMAAIRSFPV